MGAWLEPGRECVMAEFVFSVDLELGVGIEHSASSAIESPAQERKAFSKIVSLCEAYSIPATIAICGHLFLRECTGHPGFPRASPDFYEGDWFKNDPASNFEKNNEWYAPDLVELIKEKGFEIACHSFSHIPFNYCSREVAEAEISECVKIARENSVQLKSMVFPRNEVHYLDVLGKHGFTHFVSYPKADNFLIDYGTRALKFNTPCKTQGLVEVPRTMFLYRDKWTELFRMKRLLELAKLKNSFFHLWCHAYNLRSQQHVRFLEKIFRKVDSLSIEKKSVCEVTV